MTLWILITILVFGNNLAAVEEDLTKWSINTRVYSSQPQTNFFQLEKMGLITVNETAKGFLNRSIVFRDDFHLGATFCLLIDFRVFDAQKQKERILGEIKKLRNDDESVTLEIQSPSNCVKETL